MRGSVEGFRVCGLGITKFVDSVACFACVLFARLCAREVEKVCVREGWGGPCVCARVRERASERGVRVRAACGVRACARACVRMHQKQNQKP